MYCPKCGKELPDDANFCLKCGNPIHESLEKKEEPKWIICEIVFTCLKKASTVWGLSRAEIQFWAMAIGPDGQYSVAETPAIKSNAVKDVGNGPPRDGNERDIAEQELKKLKAKLIRDGWEFIGSYGSRYWELRFRRRE
jgi:hypothetical protein